MKFVIRDEWPSNMDVPDDVADAVFDRERIAEALKRVEESADGLLDWVSSNRQ